MTAHAPADRLTQTAKSVSPAGTSAMLTLAIENMHCGGCLRSVERAALKVPGVQTARASLAAKRVSIVYDPGRAGAGDFIDALKGAGFAAAAIEAAKQNRDDARQNYLLRRVAVAGFAAMNIMLISIAVWSGEASDMDPALASAFRWVSALIALPTVAYAGQPFFVSALGALKGRRLNMDVPISLAILLATAMSLYQTLRGGQQVYFDAAVSLLFFLLVGRFLDETLRVRARSEAQNLLSLQSGMATVIEPGGAHLQVPAHALRPGDRLLVAAGERVAADGVVLEGTGQVDQSLITGETAPLTVKAGQEVYAGTLNLTQAAADRGARRRQRDAARRDQPADARGRAGQGALSQARRSRGRDLCAGRAWLGTCDLPRLAARGRLMANGADLRHCRADHHLPLRARACRSCGADRRCKPAVPPQDHRQGGGWARAHRRDRHGGVRQDRHADPWAPGTH